MTVEVYFASNCKLCDDAKILLARLKKEFFFDLKEIALTEEHPKFGEYALAIPVVVFDGTRTLSGTIKEGDVRKILKEAKPPSRTFHVAKFLEALGFLTVAVGLMYGIMGNMWIDLYFFLGGILVFLVGRTLEKREMRRDHGGSLSADLAQQRS